jgi:hypothetical protein
MMGEGINMRTRLLFLVVAPLWGCNTPTYLPEHRPLETMADPNGGGYAADTDLYVLPVRRPTQDEQTALQGEQNSRSLMMPVPWVGTRDFAVQIEYSLKNLGDTRVIAYLTANGGNEFGDYVPDQYIDPTQNVEDQTPPPPLLGGSPIELQPNETRQLVFREDQIAEASLDLEAITRYPDNGDVLATPFMVIAHDSSASRIGLAGIPGSDILPLMVRFQFGLAANGHVACDYNVRVRVLGDPDDKLGTPGARGLYVPTDAMLAPPAAPPAMMPPPAP